MKVIFLDFDGVLNNQGSFILESRKRRAMSESDPNPGAVNETLDWTNASNFQYILDQHPDAKIVISSTWRIKFTLEQLEAKLSSYGVNVKDKIVGQTPRKYRGFNSAPRYVEIEAYLKEHPEVTNYVILDDEDMYHQYKERHVHTHWWTGLCFSHARKAVDFLDHPAAPMPKEESEYEEE